MRIIIMGMSITRAQGLGHRDQPARQKQKGQPDSKSRLIPVPCALIPDPSLYTSCASNVISAAFSSREIGQPSFAFLASSSNFSFSAPGTFARVVR